MTHDVCIFTFVKIGAFNISLICQWNDGSWKQKLSFVYVLAPKKGSKYHLETVQTIFSEKYNY